METLLTLPAVNSAEETAQFIDAILAQAAPLRAHMQAADTEIARLVSETWSLRDEPVRLQARQQQAAFDMDAALAGLVPHTAHR